MRPPYKPRRPGYSFAPALLVGAALSLSGCSIKARDTISAKSLEAEIAARLAATFAIPKPPVHCPAAVPAQAGSDFTCTAALYGQALAVKGTVTGPRGQVEVKPANAVVVTAEAETKLAKKLSETFHQRTEVACDVPPVLVATPGRSFGCTAALGAIKRRLAVTVTGSGALSYRVLPYEPARSKKVARPSKLGRSS
jgi:hypothetical protein